VGGNAAPGRKSCASVLNFAFVVFSFLNMDC
jgi:hypothetical protein